MRSATSMRCIKHRTHVVEEIAGLERKQDELLDRM